MSHFNLSPFFHAYSTTQQNIGLNAYYTFDTTSQVAMNSSTKWFSRNAFTYGEIQANLSNDTRYAIQLDSQLSLNHEGYQVKNVSTVGAMDDGAYGWGTGEQGMFFSDRNSASTTSTSDANQTRVWGVRTV